MKLDLDPKNGLNLKKMTFLFTYFQNSSFQVLLDVKSHTEEQLLIW